METLIGSYFYSNINNATRKLLELHNDYVLMSDPWTGTKAITMEMFTEQYTIIK